MTTQGPRYVHGHHESVLRSHTWRTVANSAAYLVPYLKPDMHILDIGCGPGTITADLAALVPQGRVTGIEQTADILSQARSTAEERGMKNVEFAIGDIHALDFPDNYFDVVHAHQVLQHVHDPVQALREMRRVTKPGGIVAARDSDYESMTYYPESEALDEWKKLYLVVARSAGGEPNAGRQLHSWARKAGFEKSATKATSSTWCYNSPEEVAWWGNLWADRIVSSAFSKNALEGGFATNKTLEEISHQWKKWSKEEDAWFTVMHGEIVYTV